MILLILSALSFTRFFTPGILATSLLYFSLGLVPEKPLDSEYECHNGRMRAEDTWNNKSGLFFPALEPDLKFPYSLRTVGLQGWSG